MPEDPFFLEEEFFSHDRKSERKQQKLAQSKDRSKYKKSNVDQQKKKRQKPTPPPPDTLQGRVLSISKDGTLVDIDGKVLICSLKGSLKKERTREKNLIAVGDFVYVKQTNDDQGQIVLIQERFSYLAREDATRRKQQLIAVNIDQIFIVASVVEPTLKPHLIDRYIIAAKKGNMQPIVLVNKIDLLNESPKEQDREALLIKTYESLNIPILPVSALCGTSIDRLQKMMYGKTSVFSGQSGVGKSSLLNASLGLHLKTGKISQKNNKGSHVTTKAELIRFEKDGFCIDTPGIKSFGIWKLSHEEILSHFSEITELAHNCKFPNCTHLHEPNCAVYEAVEENRISNLRFESYRSLMSDMQAHQNY